MVCDLPMLYLYFIHIFQMSHEQTDLLINLNGQTVCVKGVTRHTTCDDVIEMVFYNSPKSRESYAIFESSYGVERMLYGKESVLKCVRSWGVEHNCFTLVLRKLDNIKSSMATLSKARRKLRKIRSQNAKLSAYSAGSNNTIQANCDNLNNKMMKDKDIENLERMPERERSGKLGILKRFLSDVVLNTKRQRKEKQLQTSVMLQRTPGDGCDANMMNSNTLEMTTSTNEPQDTTCNETLRRYNSYMNAAFVDFDDTNDETTQIMLDNAELESAFEDFSDTDSVSELERNILELSNSDSEDIDEFESDSEDRFSFSGEENTVIKCERIRNMFNKAQVDELDDGDDDMEKFMKSLVYDSESDEGVSSLGSNDE